MTVKRVVTLVLAILAFVAILTAAQSGQRPRRSAQYEREMQNPVPDPPDAYVEAEFTVGRLRFRSPMDRGRGRGSRWGTDANKGDRVFSQVLRRLTRVNTRSVEEVVDIDSDEMYKWPFLFAVGIGDWQLSVPQVQRLRNYFDRGGFLMVDDFHGPREWRNFADGIARILPNSTIVELKDDDAIFHTVYDLNERYQVSGLNVVYGAPYERGGVVPHWRAVVDEKGRVQVAINYNMDVGDSWEWADHPEYPERLASLGMRMGVNYVVYAMTH